MAKQRCCARPRGPAYPTLPSQDDKLHFVVFESKDCKGPVSLKKSLPAKKGVCYHGEGKDYKQYCRRTKAPETPAHRRARKDAARQGSLEAQEAPVTPKAAAREMTAQKEHAMASAKNAKTGKPQQAFLTMWHNEGCNGVPDNRASLAAGQCIAGEHREELVLCKPDRVLRHVFKAGSGCAGKPLHTESRPRSQCAKEGDGASIRVDCAESEDLLDAIDGAFDGGRKVERKPAAPGPSATGAAGAATGHATGAAAPAVREVLDEDIEEMKPVSSSTGSAQAPVASAARGAEAVVGVMTYEDGACQAPLPEGAKELTTEMCLEEPSLRKSFRFVCRHGEPLRRVWFAGNTCGGEAVEEELVGSKCAPMGGVGSFHAKCRFNREAAEEVESDVRSSRVVQTIFSSDSCAGLPVQSQGLVPEDCLVNHVDNTSFRVGCAGGGDKVRVTTFSGIKCAGETLGRFDVSSGTCQDMGGVLGTLSCDMDGENDEEHTVQKVWEGLSSDVNFVHASFRGDKCEGKPRNYASLTGGCHHTSETSSQEVLCGHDHLVIRTYATGDCTGAASSDFVSPVSNRCVPDGHGGSLLATCSQGAVEAGPDTEEELEVPAATGPSTATDSGDEEAGSTTGATGATGATGCEQFKQPEVEEEPEPARAEGSVSGGDFLPEWELEVALFAGGEEAKECRGPMAEVVRVPNGCYMPQGMRGSVQVRCSPDGELESMRYTSKDCSGEAASRNRQDVDETCSAQVGGYVRERCVRAQPRASVSTVTTSVFSGEGEPCAGAAEDTLQRPEGACSPHGVSGSVSSSCTHKDGLPAVVRVVFDTADCSGEPSSHTIVGRGECVKDAVMNSYVSATCGAASDSTELSLAEVASRLAVRHTTRLPGSLRGQ